MKKQDLAEALAAALNLIDNMRCLADETDARRDNAWYGLCAKLPAEVRENLKNNGTVYAKELV